MDKFIMSDITENTDLHTALDTINKNILMLITIVGQENEDKKRRRTNELEEHNIKLEEPGYKIECVKEEDIYSKFLPGLKIGKQIQVYYTRMITQEDTKIKEER